MTVLVLDVGNTRTKWRLFDGATGGGVFSAALPSAVELASFKGVIDVIACGSVRGVGFDQELTQAIKSTLDLSPEFMATETVWGPLINGYNDTSTLGVDRWLAMVAAWHHIGSELIVVDAGTAVTLDVVDANGQHLGGYILPGFRTMVASLNAGANLIRVAEAHMPAGVGLGQTTVQAVNHGCVKMLAAFIASECAARPDARLVLTGGGSQSIIESLPVNISFLPDLVLEGIFLSYQSGQQNSP